MHARRLPRLLPLALAFLLSPAASVMVIA
ncbi:hypothetical protein K3Z89_26485, partial [Pseudomonas aeruginosa]|nr:hypothetical protein [Pseudomonas aeruginosa]